MGASVKDIQHERAWLESDVMSVAIRVVVETRGKDHAAVLKQTLCDRGYK